MSTTTQIRGTYRKPERQNDGAYHIVRTDVDMDIVVDWNALADLMAEKLARNKSGRSVIHGGIIEMTRRKVTTTDMG